MYIKTVKMPKKIIFGIVLSCLSLSSYAINLGELNILSEKNQPLRAEIDLGGLTQLELHALRLDLTSSDNTDLKAYGVQTAIEKKGSTYIAKITSKKSLPLTVLDIKIQANINGMINEKTYSNLIKSSGKKTEASTDIIRANPTPIKSNNQNQQASGSKYTVKSGDTLFDISNNHSKNLNDVSLDQVIVAIYQSNKNAFLSGNMNRLKSGSELNLPSAEEASKYDQRGAKQEILARTTQYNKYKNRLSDFVTQRTPENQASTSQKGSVNTQNSKVEITNQTDDNLKLTKPDSKSITQENKLAQELKQKEQDNINIQNQAIAEKQKKLDELNSSGSQQSASMTIASPTEEINDDRQNNPLGLTSSATNESKEAIQTSPAVASLTQAQITPEKKRKGIWPFLLIVIGVGGLGFYVYRKRKNDSLNQSQEDSLFSNPYFNAPATNNLEDDDHKLDLSLNRFNDNQAFNLGTNQETKKPVDNSFDDDHLFNDDIPVINNIQETNKLNNNSLDDDHLFNDDIPIVEDTNKIEPNIITEEIPTKQEVENSFIEFNEQVDEQIQDPKIEEEINFDDIPTLSFEDEVVEESSSSQGSFYDTKLELAKAYLDIEDFSGATMLLEELSAQNEDKKIQKQAKALLKEINE